jgi:hypothetical protein
MIRREPGKVEILNLVLPFWAPFHLEVFPVLDPSDNWADRS